MDVKLWRKRHAAARVRREFRTAEEVLHEAAEQPAAAPRQAILDMRGPQVTLFRWPLPHLASFMTSAPALASSLSLVPETMLQIFSGR